MKVSSFVAEIKLPFSDNYYRDVEAGRKTLSLEAAEELRLALDIEIGEKEFVDYYWHYFRDVLNEKVHETLFGRGEQVSDVKDMLELREYDSKILRRALSISRYEREHIADERVIHAFSERIELLPLMTYLYMVESASPSELASICSNIGVAWNDSARSFLETVSKPRATRDSPYIRLAPTLRLPRSPGSMELKDNFLRWEIERSLEKEDQPEYFEENGTFKYSAMITLREGALGRVQDRIVDFFSELEVETKSGRQLEDPSAKPYFVAVVFSGRPEYDGRAARETSIRKSKKR